MNSNSGSHHHLHQHQHHNNHGNPYPSNDTSKGKGSGSPGGNGMAYMEESGAGVLPLQQQHSHSHSGPPLPIPPGWVKSHQHPLHHPLSGNGNSSPSSSVSSNYGAPSNYLQQSFYSPDPHAAGGVDGSSVSSPMRPGPNYSTVNNSSSPCPYYPSDPRVTDFYHQHHQNQFSSATFDPSVKRRGGGASDEPMTNFYPGGTNSNNFYPLPQQSGHGHHYAEFSTDYSRMHYASANAAPSNNSCNAADYFTGPSSSTNRSSSSCPTYGHHHVSTPLEFHHQQPPHLQPQSFRRNSIESFSSETGESPYNAKYAFSGTSPTTAVVNNPRFNPHLIKRETIIPPGWSNEHPSTQEQQEHEQYFHNGSGVNVTSHTQYHRPLSSSSTHGHHHRCEGHGPPTTPPVLTTHQGQSTFCSEKSLCSFDTSMDESGSGSHYKKVGGVKHRSQSVSYSRNFDHPHHFRSSVSIYQNHHHHQHQHLAPSTLNVSINKDVPVLPEVQSQGQDCGSESVGNRTSDPSFTNKTTPIMTLTQGGQAQCDDEDEGNEQDTGMESDSSSSRSNSPKSSFTTASADCNQSEDNISDLEEELKKEIESVTTTTGGSDHGTTSGELKGDESIHDPDVNHAHTGQPIPSNPTPKLDTENDLSNSSLTLFDSIALNTFDSPGGGEGGVRSDMDPVDNHQGRLEDLEDQDSLSGLSSISSHDVHRHRFHHPNSLTCGEEKSRSRSTSPGPQKILKRSFSEADKELVLNTTAITAAALAYSSRGLSLISIPKGWRREMTLSGTNPNSSCVFYISPSDTKLRTLEEVKNYITADGTCKCGLSCPLHLERTFSFDPKVTNSCQEEEESVLNGNEDGRRRLCCNHKRKIPLSEDSPLISSTRDDLGDSGDGERLLSFGGAKKRRTELSPGTSGVIVSLKNETKNRNSNLLVIPKTSASSSTPPTHYNQNVSVPFAQQSPDTTTQTPQRDMSPASSVSSDTSIVFTSRSTNSTPTPMGVKTSPIPNNSLSTPPGKGQTSEFAWPILPGSNAPLVRPQTPPSGSVLSTWINTSPSIKNSNYQHHLISKSPLKRAPSPCPNVDVRKIPIDQNQPPPRQGQTISPISISISLAGASHPSQTQSSVSLVPILNTSTSQGENSNPLTHLNTGYSISPILSNQSVASTLQFTSILPTTGYCHQSISMPRLVSSSGTIPSTGISSPPSLPSSITISMVGQEPFNSQIPGTTVLPKLVQKTSNPKSRTMSGPLETSSEKSPLQLVQDVVDRFNNDDHSGQSQENNNSVNLNNNGAEVNNNSNSENVTEVLNEESQSIETKIMKIIAEAASASAKAASSTPFVSSPNTMNLTLPKPEDQIGKGLMRYGMNLNMLPISSVPMSLPLISSSPITLQSLPQTIFTSNATTITTTSSATPNLPIMTSNSILNCGPNPLGVSTSNTGLNLNNGNQLILQQQTDPSNPSLRYPIFQTLQPIFLNPGGGSGLLIPNSSDPQSFIQIDQNGQPHSGAGGDLLHSGTTTMVIDPSSMCGNAGQFLSGGPGPKKKKKRLSKKQQQQQAQLQLQQQLLLQQLLNHQQVQQQHAQQQIPLLLPPSFNLGPQGFLQPMNMNMNFFPTPTILTLPNLILNPADGTLFIQQTGPQLSSANAPPPTSTMPPTMKITGGMPIQVAATQPNTHVVIPRKETVTLPSTSGLTLTATSPETTRSSELVVDDSSRQNATPDSSTNDCQLGLITSAPQLQPTPITVSLPLGSSTNLQSSKKGPIKSKVVSSSTTTTVHKRILPQKQILPKIDSTTSSVENN